MMYDPSFLLLFVPGVWLAWAIAGRVHPAGRGAVLLAASILFCGQLGVPVLAFCSLFALLNLAGARLLAKRPSAWLAGTLIASNIAVLAVFKYASFLADSVAAAVGAHAPALHILAPAGLSFLFFRAVSALIEIRRGSLAGFGNLDYLLYLLYFPTYLAGPIATFGEVEPQLEGARGGRHGPTPPPGWPSSASASSRRWPWPTTWPPSATEPSPPRPRAARSTSWRPGAPPWPTASRSISTFPAIRTWPSD